MRLLSARAHSRATPRVALRPDPPGDGARGHWRFAGKGPDVKAPAGDGRAVATEPARGAGAGKRAGAGSSPGRPSIDWPFVAHGVGSAALVGTMALHLWSALSHYIDNPDALFGDSRLYWRATEAWVSGGDPWAASHNGIVFAGIPPTLLLNLPLVPFGEDLAWAFWPVAGLIGMTFALRRLGLPLWWLLWPPVMEGLLPGSPDLVLMGLIVAGVGWISAVAKPYVVPAMLWEGRWRSVVLAALIGVATMPLLPWPRFADQWPAIATAYSVQTRDFSAWPDPLAMFAVTLALVSLGRFGLGLATPGLWPQAQLHYGLFSVSAAARSRLLAVGLGFPLPGVGPVAIIVYAGWRLIAAKMARSKMAR